MEQRILMVDVLKKDFEYLKLRRFELSGATLMICPTRVSLWVAYWASKDGVYECGGLRSGFVRRP
jgi:hypothetical protein